MKSDSRRRGQFFLLTTYLVTGLFVSAQTAGENQRGGQAIASEHHTGHKLQTFTAAVPGSSADNPGHGGETDEKAALKKAHGHYARNNYAEAIPYFEKVVRAGLNKSALIRLAQCYRLTGDVQGQLRCYSLLLENGLADPVHELYYGQALLQNNETEKGRAYFEKYGCDPQAEELREGFGKIKNFRRNSDAYQLLDLITDSVTQEQCAVTYKGQLICSSVRPASLLLRLTGRKSQSDLVPVNADNSDQRLYHFLSDINSHQNETAISFGKNEHTFFLTTESKTRATDGTYKLRIAEGTIKDGKAGPVKDLSFINKEFNYAYASVSADGDQLFFSSDMPGGKGGMDLYRCERTPEGAWGTPRNLGGVINTAEDEVFPFVSPEGLLYFSSDGQPGMGGLDIFETTIDSTMGTVVFNMGEPVNSAFDDFGFFAGKNNKAFFTSSRNNRGRNNDLFELRVQRKVTRGKDVLIVLKDARSGQPLPESRVLLNGDTLFSSGRGELLVQVPVNQTLRIVSLSEDHFRLQDSISFSDPEVVKELFLEKRPKVFLRGLLTDITTNELLEGVRVRIKDLVTGQMVDDYTTNHAGDYFKFLNDLRLGEQIHYQFSLHKEGYFDKTFTLKHIITSPGEISLNEHSDLKFGKISKGLNIAEIAGTGPLDIHPAEGISEAQKAELDKIAELLLDYPAIAIEVAAHTDCRGKAVSNMGRTAEQAKMIMEYLLSKGIDKVRLSARGYGESKLLNNCGCEGKVKSDCPEEEHAKNRRTEFVITNVI